MSIYEQNDLLISEPWKAATHLNFCFSVLIFQKEKTKEKIFCQDFYFMACRVVAVFANAVGIVLVVVCTLKWLTVFNVLSLFVCKSFRHFFLRKIFLYVGFIVLKENLCALHCVFTILFGLLLLL